MTTKPFAIAIYLAASLLPLRAQQASNRVAGRVVSSLDQHPIAHATVTLLNERPGSKPLTTTASDDGDFAFTAVARGTFRLTGAAPGYITLPYQGHDNFYTGVVTSAGLATDNLVLQIDPASSISGHIVDEAGDPVQRAQVTLYRDLAGHITSARNIQADTDGEYTFDKLQPGRYFLTVKATPWYAVYPHTDQPQEVPPYRNAVDPALDVAYPLTYYPRATTSDGASPITLAGGNQVTADMQLSPTPAISISIHISSGTPANQRFPAITRSVFGTDEPVQIQMTENINGTTRLPGFAPGQYKIQAIGPDGRPQTSPATIDLTTGSTAMDLGGNADLANVSVTLHTANGESLPTHLEVVLRYPRADDYSRAFTSDFTSDKDTLEVHDVPVGSYRINLPINSGHPWNILATTVNGKRSPDNLLHITASGNIPVDLTISSTIATIEGFARRDGKPADGSMVILVPAGGDTSEDLFRRDQSNTDGSFTFADVVPGNYLVVAIDDGWSLRWDDPTTLTPYLMHAIPISIPATSSPTIHLPEPVPTQPR